MIRVGQGYDVHRYAEGRRLVLGGVTVPFEKGLSGHSDADVLIHAVIDAILGAAAAGDIGALFPDSDDKYRDIDSRILLREAAKVVKDKGYAVVNVDATVICQRPKLAPFIAKMRENIAEDLGLAADAVSVKVTTEEGLGFTGREEGVAATAVALIEK